MQLIINIIITIDDISILIMNNVIFIMHVIVAVVIVIVVIITIANGVTNYIIIIAKINIVNITVIVLLCFA